MTSGNSAVAGKVFYADWIIPGMLLPFDSLLQVLCTWTSVTGIDGSAQQLQLGKVVGAGIQLIKALNNTMVGRTGSI